MTIGTVAVTEVVWTAIASVGVVISLLMANDALKTLHYLQGSGQNGVREMWAQGNVRSEWFRLAVHCISVIIGIIAMSTPPVNPDVPITRLSIVLSSGLILISVLLVIASITTRLTRNRAIAMLVEASRIRAAMVPEQIQRDAEDIKVKAIEVEAGAESIREKAAGMQQDQEAADEARLRDEEAT